MKSALINEVFAIRNDERITLLARHEKGCLAVQLVTTVFPDSGDYVKISGAGNKTLLAGFAAARKNPGGFWGWVAVSPPTKEFIADFLEDTCKVEKDKWYYIAFESDAVNSDERLKSEKAEVLEALNNLVGDLEYAVEEEYGDLFVNEENPNVIAARAVLEKYKEK